MNTIKRKPVELVTTRINGATSTNIFGRIIQKKRANKSLHEKSW